MLSIKDLEAFVEIERALAQTPEEGRTDAETRGGPGARPEAGGMRQSHDLLRALMAWPRPTAWPHGR